MGYGIPNFRLFRSDLQTDALAAGAGDLGGSQWRDAMQEAALKAWAKRYTLREEKYFATWLTRILINECYAMRRKQKRFVPLEDIEYVSAPAHDPMLSLALQSLPEELRLPLVMHSLEGMSYKEISKVLRLPHSTITGRIHRAKQQLRKELEG